MKYTTFAFVSGTDLAVCHESGGWYMRTPVGWVPVQWGAVQQVFGNYSSRPVVEAVNGLDHGIITLTFKAA